MLFAQVLDVWPCISCTLVPHLLTIIISMGHSPLWMSSPAWHFIGWMPEISLLMLNGGGYGPRRLPASDKERWKKWLSWQSRHKNGHLACQYLNFIHFLGLKSWVDNFICKLDSGSSEIWEPLFLIAWVWVEVENGGGDGVGWGHFQETHSD